MSKAKTIDTGHKGFHPGEPPAITREGPQKRYKVSVTYLKPAVLRAASPEEAFEKFKLLNGMIETDHEPQITEATEEEEVTPVKEEEGKRDA